MRLNSRMDTQRIHFPFQQKNLGWIADNASSRVRSRTSANYDESTLPGSTDQLSNFAKPTDRDYGASGFGAAIVGGIDFRKRPKSLVVEITAVVSCSNAARTTSRLRRKE